MIYSHISHKPKRLIYAERLAALLLSFGLTLSMAHSAHANDAKATATATATAKVNRVIVSKSSFSQGYDDKLNACSSEFIEGAAPRLTGTQGARMSELTYPLCFNGFGTLYSGITRTPFWSASHLTESRIREARTLARTDSFRAEMHLPAEHRSELADYRRSGYDRGHVAPNGDMATLPQQYDSFSLANIVPQNHEHNRHIWRDIEITARNLALKHGEVYVVTGVAFSAPTVERIGGRVMVPSHFYKAIYIPKLSAAGVYYSANDATGSYELISLNELKNRTGVDAMPALSAAIKANAYRLPDPKLSAESSSITDITDAISTLPALDFSKEGLLSLAVGIFRYVVEMINKA